MKNSESKDRNAIKALVIKKHVKNEAQRKRKEDEELVSIFESLNKKKTNHLL